MDPNETSIEDRVRALSRAYSEESAVYEEHWAAGLREMGRELLGRMPLEDAGRVLDVGAGVGALLPDLATAAPAAHVIGSDRAAGMIARAHAGFGRCVGDATGLPFADGAFDSVTFVFVLFHLPHPVDGLAEAHRVLARGGWVGCATWAEQESWPALEVWNDELDRAGAADGEGWLSQHEFVDTPEKLAMHLRDARFRDVQTWTGVLEREWDLDGVLGFATGMARAKRRLDSLEPERREEFLRVVTDRLSTLPADALNSRSEVVFAIARR